MSPSSPTEFYKSPESKSDLFLLLLRPKSARNRCVIEHLWRYLCCHFAPLNVFTGVGDFVIGLSQISSFFSFFWKANSRKDRGMFEVHSQEKIGHI